MTSLLIAPGRGIDVYQPVFREGFPLAIRSQRGAALAGFAVGVLRAPDLAAAARAATEPRSRCSCAKQGASSSARGRRLDDAATAPIRIANRSWTLVLSDHDKPTLALPLAIARRGLLLAALTWALLLLWGRSESIARGIASKRIGERDRAEAERQRTEHRYRVLAENSIDMIGVSDLEGTLVYVSPSSLTLFGFQPEEMVGRSGFDFIHPDDLESGAEPSGTLLVEPRSVTYQCRFLRKDGSYSGSRPRHARSPIR